MDPKSGLKTEEVVVTFVKRYLHDKGHTWNAAGFERTFANNDKLRELIASLIATSKELEQFIEQTNKDTFEETLRIVFETNFTYDHMKALADEIFYNGISFFPILTFLVHGASVCCKALDTNTENQNTGGASNTVRKITKFMIRYINEELLEWITEEHEEGWLGIIHHPLPSASDSGGADNHAGHKSMRYQFGMVAIAVFLGGFYLCSKLSPVP